MTKVQNMIGLRFAMVLSGLSRPSMKREEGQTLTEYALILALIAVVVIGAVTLLGSKVTNIFNGVTSSL